MDNSKYIFVIGQSKVDSDTPMRTNVINIALKTDD